MSRPIQKQKGISTLIGTIIIVAVAIVAFGGVFAYQYFTKFEIRSTKFETNSNVQKLNIQNETAGWKTYTNTQYGFEIKYPSSWLYSEFTWNANINGIAFCPTGAGYDKSNCADVPMMNTPSAPIFINTASKPITSSSLNSLDEKYKDIYIQMLSTFKFTK